MSREQETGKPGELDVRDDHGGMSDSEEPRFMEFRMQSRPKDKKGIVNDNMEIDSRSSVLRRHWVLKSMWVSLKYERPSYTEPPITQKAAYIQNWGSQRTNMNSLGEALTKHSVTGTRWSVLKWHFLRRDLCKDPIYCHVYLWGICVYIWGHKYNRVPMYIYGSQRETLAVLFYHSVPGPFETLSY